MGVGTCLENAKKNSVTIWKNFSNGKVISDHIMVLKLLLLFLNVLWSSEKHFVYFKVLLFKGLIQICDYSFNHDRMCRF